MKIVSWNMAHRKNQDKAWAYLLKGIKPDIALLQECKCFNSSISGQPAVKSYQGQGIRLGIGYLFEKFVCESN